MVSNALLGFDQVLLHLLVPVSFSLILLKLFNLILRLLLLLVYLGDSVDD